MTDKMYALQDTKLKGFITWQEKGAIAVFLFSSGEKAEEYWHQVFPTRPLSVYAIDKRRLKDFVVSMTNADIGYAVIDVPWQHADVNEVYDDEVVRDYAIVDLRTLNARIS